MNAEPTITCRDVKLWYGNFQALLGVSADILHGQITSLIGPSGCGKTTLLRCFNRVNERYGNVRTEGEIKILGKNIYEADVSPVELRKKVGMVFQRPNPLPISVYENVAFGLRIHYAAAAQPARARSRGPKRRSPRPACGMTSRTASTPRQRPSSSSSSKSSASPASCR